MARSCGACSVCCTSLEVPELDKAAGQSCSNLTSCKSRACSIYNERPDACSTFKCGWLLGLGNSTLRPDKSGILLYSSDSIYGEALVVSLLREGADRSTLGKRLINELRSKLDGSRLNLLIRRSYESSQGEE